MRKLERRLDVELLEDRLLLSCDPGAPDYNPAACADPIPVKNNKISKVTVKQLTGSDKEGSFQFTVRVKGDPGNTAIVAIFAPGDISVASMSGVVSIGADGYGDKVLITNRNYIAGPSGTIKFRVEVKTGNTVTDTQTLDVRPKAPRMDEITQTLVWDEDEYNYE